MFLDYMFSKCFTTISLSENREDDIRKSKEFLFYFLGERRVEIQHGNNKITSKKLQVSKMENFWNNVMDSRNISIVHDLISSSITIRKDNGIRFFLYLILAKPKKEIEIRDQKRKNMKIDGEEIFYYFLE